PPPFPYTTLFRSRDPARPGLDQVRRHADLEPRSDRLARFIEMQVSSLFVDDSPAAGADVDDRQVGVSGELANALAFHVEGEEVVFAVAIGAEVDGVAE